MAALVDLCHLPLARYALRLTADGDAMAEVMQETWLAIVRGLRGLEDAARFRSWAYRIVTHKCADWIRSRAHRRQTCVPLDQELLAGSPSDEEPTDEIAALRKALSQLPPERRAILAMFYLDDLSIRDIAAALSLPEGTVKSRLFHAREELRQSLHRPGS